MRVTPLNTTTAGACFSADGNSLLIACTDADRLSANASESGIVPTRLFRADGWQQAISNTEPGAITDLTKHEITTDDRIDAQPAWSPDKKWIVCVSPEPESTDLFAMRPDGTGRVPLHVPTGAAGQPVFSPDGRQLLYSLLHDGRKRVDVFRCDLTRDVSGNITGATHHTQLTQRNRVNFAAIYTPDGKTILYASAKDFSDTPNLFAMRPDGRMNSRLTFGPSVDLSPALSSDGKTLLWTSDRSPERTMQVFIANLVLPEGL